jgi:hypothetical protein
MPETALVLRPSRWKHFAYFLVCVVFTAIGVWQLRLHPTDVVGWISVVFFGLGSAIFIVQFLPGASYLRVEQEGFLFCSLYRKSPLIPWRDVSDFRVASVPPVGHPLVVFDWHTAPSRRFRAANQFLVSATDGLPDTYGLPPRQLAGILNEWRSRGSVG